MKMFIGKLLSVETGEYNSLVFASQRFDTGLSKFVECSENIGISKECLVYASEYKQKIGEVVAVGINVIPTKKGGVFTLVTTKPLNMDEIGL